MEFAGIWKDKGRVFGAPAYWAFRTYARLQPEKVVDTRIQVADYSIENGNNRIPDIPNVPYLDVVSTLGRNGELVLFCINRDLHRPVDARIHLSGFNAANTAHTTTIHATLIDDKNSAEYPNAIRPVEKQISAGPDFSYNFEPASITAIEIPAK